MDTTIRISAWAEMKIQDIASGWTHKNPMCMCAMCCVTHTEKANDLNKLKVENESMGRDMANEKPHQESELSAL